MPVGVPDFWPGQLIHYEGIPTDGRLDASPTSNWAYDHEHLAKHAAFVTSAADVLLYSRPVYTRMLGLDSWWKTKADLTLDGAWHDLTVPFGGSVPMEGVVLRVIGSATDVDMFFELRGTGNVGLKNVAALITQAIGVQIQADVIVGVDEDGVLQYRGGGPGTWLVLNMLMTGFFR